MIIHHLNCGTMRPYGGRLVSGSGRVLAAAELVCHCLVLEADHGLVLVDTGLGAGDVTDPDATLSRTFQRLARPVLEQAETAVHQVERLGFRAEDVRDIVLTHLDLDHAGGLRDFPHARVHVLRSEREAARSAHTTAERTRYPRGQWAHGPQWVTHDPRGEEWFGFAAVRELPGVPAEILLVPLVGHTVGHTGVAVRDGDGWLLHAGDAYFFHDEIHADAPVCPPALRLMQATMETARGLRLANQERLRELVRGHGDEITVFSAHDATELRSLQRRRAEAPGRARKTTS